MRRSWAVAAILVVAVVGCSLVSHGTGPGDAKLVKTPAGEALATRALVRSADLPPHYAASGSAGVHGAADCVDARGMTLEGRAATGFEPPSDAPLWMTVASQSFVFAKRSDARRAFASVRAASFGDCLEKSLVKVARRQELLDHRVSNLALSLPLRQLAAGAVRAYRVALRVRDPKDGSAYTMHVDVAAVLVGRTLSLDAFLLVDNLTPEATLAERTAVARAAVRAWPPASAPALGREVDRALARDRAAAARQEASAARIAGSLLLRLSDLPEGYKRAGRWQSAEDDCADFLDATVLAQRSSAEFDPERSGEDPDTAGSTAWVVDTPAAAREVMRALGRKDVLRCFGDSLRAEAEAKSSTEEPIAFRSGGLHSGDVRGYTVAAELVNGTPEASLRLDVVTVRRGRAVALFEFSSFGLRTRTLAATEEAAVTRALARVQPWPTSGRRSTATAP